MAPGLLTSEEARFDTGMSYWVRQCLRRPGIGMRRWDCQCLRRLDLAQYEALGLLVFEETGPAMVKPLVVLRLCYSLPCWSPQRVASTWPTVLLLRGGLDPGPLSCTCGTALLSMGKFCGRRERGGCANFSSAPFPISLSG